MGASICVCFQTDVWAVERVFYLCISHADVTCLYHPCLNIIQWEYIGSFGFGMLSSSGLGLFHFLNTLKVGLDPIFSITFIMHVYTVYTQ